ncbi:MAG: hypothetical protein K8T26_17710 [Lentisphaerae bacterium]|nr:hypothetical protein [Lentisphaerota bacterium]
MTHKQRVAASLAHKPPDRVPYHVSFTAPARARMAEFYGNPAFESELDNCLFELDTALPGGGRMVAPAIWEDEFGVRWDRSIDPDIGNVCNRLITPATLGPYRFPDPDAPARFAHYPEAIQKHRDQFIIADIGFSLFERAWTLAGMDALLMAMVEQPAFVHELLDRILEHNLRLIDRACRHEIDGMWFGDDWGQQRGMIMGPRLWRTFLKPRLQHMYAAVKGHRKAVFIHCCGKVDDILPDLVEMGVDVFNPFQPEVMDVYAMKKRYGDRLAFWGGISTQQTLPLASVAEVKADVRRLLEHLGKDGGYIAAPAHAIPGDARPENVAAMLEVLNA